MYEYASGLVRQGLLSVGGFLAAVQRRIMSWVQGDDVSIIIFLALIALLVLFVLVPNRRRY